MGTVPNAKGVTFYRVDPTGSEGEINGCNNSTVLWSVDILTPLKKSQIDARYQPAEGKIAVSQREGVVHQGMSADVR